MINTEINLLYKFTLACAIAYDVHQYQTDKAGEPYIKHPIRLVYEIDNHTWASEEFKYKLKIVAMLHDVLEDDTTGKYTVSYIQQNFGTEIAEAVHTLTHSPNEPYMDYIARIKKNVLACNVKKFDLKDNLNLFRLANSATYEFTEKDANRIEKYFKAYRFLEYD